MPGCFSGIQGALVFALQAPPSRNRRQARTLFEEFVRQKGYPLNDLWPLYSGTGTPLSKIRNSIVHGEAFSEGEFMALSYAAENLQWHLERIILIALGWDKRSPQYPVRRSITTMPITGKRNRTS